jgi:hypothetical protein
MRFILKPLTTLLLPFVCLNLAFGQTQTNLPPHPRLLLNAEGIAQLKQRIATASWAKTDWDELKARADRSLEKAVVLPPRGGNWSHNYVCPIHGARLQQGKQIGEWQWEHICPIGGHVLHGDPAKATLDFDGNAIMGIHLNYAQQILDDGLLFQMTGETRYPDKAREILLAYAARYLTYQMHDNQGQSNGKGGRVASQSLTEATWLIDVMQGADFIWDTLNEAERKAVTEKLLMPALNEIIIPDRHGIHNIQCRQNSAIGLAGYLLNDPKLIALAIDDPKIGLRQQLAQGVRDDGMWLEGSTGYHFFTIAGLWPLMEAARNCCVDLYSPQFKKMFDGPFALAMPNFSLPNFNDSGISPLQEHADVYELAFARFGDPAYAPMLARSSRHDRMALFFGATNLPAGNPSSVSASRNLEASGYAILQQGQGARATWLGLKYGPHGGGHGHPDKNSFILYARGQVLAPDVGTHAYGSPLHAGWDKTTLAHNTLVVDEKSQEPAQGKCLAFGNQNGVDFSVTEAGPIYPNVHFTRTAAMLTPDLIVFVDQIQSDKPHTLDLAYHQMGEWENLPASKSWAAPASNGYKYFTRTTTRSQTAPSNLQTKIGEDWRPLIALAGGEPTEIITGYGLLKTTEDLVPLLVQRRVAERTAFVWAVSMSGEPVMFHISSLHSAKNEPVDQSEALLVDVTSGGRSWSLLVNPHRQPVQAKFADGPAALHEEIFLVK